MTFLHLADLHIGKRLCERDLLPDQRFALEAIVAEAARRKPDAIFIAGDLYDRANPSTAAVSLCDWFLTALHGLGAPVFVIGGNHDSQERLAFGRSILGAEGLYIAGPYNGAMQRVTLTDAAGPVDVWLLPFVRPKEAEPLFEGAAFSSSQEAVEAILAREAVDSTRRNVLLTHFFVSSKGSSMEESDSEINPIGGLSQVDATLFDGFDYVALGHLHAAQQAGRPAVRYAGSPLKYSFSEARQRKSCVFGELKADRSVALELVPVPCLHDVREIQGPLERLISPEVVAQADPADYLRVTLTDPEPPLQPSERLATVYPNVLRLDLPAVSAPEDEAAPLVADGMDDETLLRAFYRQSTGGEMPEDLLACARQVMNDVREAT